MPPAAVHVLQALGGRQKRANTRLDKTYSRELTDDKNTDVLRGWCKGIYTLPKLPFVPGPLDPLGGGGAGNVRSRFLSTAVRVNEPCRNHYRRQLDGLQA